MQGQTCFCGDFSSFKPQAPPLRLCSLGISEGHMERGPNLRGDATSPLTVRTSTSTAKVLILCCVTWSWSRTKEMSDRKGKQIKMHILGFGPWAEFARPPWLKRYDPLCLSLRKVGVCGKSPRPAYPAVPS